MLIFVPKAMKHERCQQDLTTIEKLNLSCNCVTVDLATLQQKIEAECISHGLSKALVESHPHLFATSPVFLSHDTAARMQKIIHAIETIIAMPVYQEKILEWAPAIAQYKPGSIGVFYSYDFHLDDSGPQLIEINTSAGGPMLNVMLTRAQHRKCEAVDGIDLGPTSEKTFEEIFFTMFMDEWQRKQGNKPLKTIAIVDDNPTEQYLYPEFILFQKLFKTYGIEAFIVDAKTLSIKNQRLYHNNVPIDLVYNRLIDFYFTGPEHAVIREAYLNDYAVITPHPRAHALYSNKRDLTVLTDPTLLRSWGVPEETISILSEGIPTTFLVDPTQAKSLWSDRKHLFFKPVSGYAGKGTYRGDKLTRRVFGEILTNEYVAQKIIHPSERHFDYQGTLLKLKVDLRNYVYNSHVQLLAARLYNGQTTNFRTPGGGFAPVFYPIKF